MWLFDLFNNKPKTVESIAYKLFLKSNGMNDTDITKSAFNDVYNNKNINTPYQSQAELILRKEKIKKLKGKIKESKCLKSEKN